MNIVLYVKKDDKILLWSDISADKRKEIAQKLNIQGVTASGYRLKKGQ